jgi:hypothetical protein
LKAGFIRNANASRFCANNASESISSLWSGRLPDKNVRKGAHARASYGLTCLSIASVSGFPSSVLLVTVTLAASCV